MEQLISTENSRDELTKLVELFRARCSYSDPQTQEELNFYMEKVFARLCHDLLVVSLPDALHNRLLLSLHPAE